MTLADEMKDAHAKTIMVGIARSYEQIAKLFDKGTREPGGPLAS